LPYTVRALADIVGRPAEMIAEQSSATAERIYGLQSCRF
ncbi:MAG: DNAase, partial [Mycobacterium sp.]